MEGTHDFGTCAEGLLAENMVALLNGLDGLLGVDGGSAGDNDGLQGLFLGEHILEGEVCSDAELLLCGVELGLHGRADGNQLGAGRESCKVSGMAHSHAANACDCYLKLFRHDCEM